MALISDPSGDRLFAENPPQRVVSLCPAITELLFDIGMKSRVVGVSKQCRFPEISVKETGSTGSNKRPDLRRIQEMQPDFVVVDSRETQSSVIDLLKDEYPVWDSTTSTVLDAITEVRELGRIMDKSLNADWIANKIETRFAEFQDGFQKPPKSIKVAFLANYKPWSAYGTNTLADELLGYIGAENVWATDEGVFSVEQKKVPGGNATIILVAEGPYSFHKRHLPVVNRRFPDSSVHLVPEDLLTWHGSRLLRAPAYLKELSKRLIQ